MAKILLYSPTQVGLSTFLGGPFAAIYVLKKNFDALGNKSGSRYILIVGGILVVILFVVLPFLPKDFPRYSLTILYIVAARLVAEKQQLSKQAIQTSVVYGFRSAWNVVGISAGFFVLALVLIFLWMIFLAQVGVIIL